jgi:hypothetical protein
MASPPRSCVTGVVLALALPTAAAAEPAAAVQRTADVASPVDDFPGTFDAASVERGRWNLQLLPVPELRHGLTDELAVGVSATTLLRTAAGSPTVSIDLRYRLWGRGRWASTLSLGAAYGAGHQFLHRFEAALTVERRATSRRSMALTIYGGGVHAEVAGDEDTMDTTAFGVEGGVVMLSHLHFPARWFGYQLAVGWMPYLNAQGDVPGVTIDARVSDAIPVAARAMVMFKPGQAWMLTFGVPGAPLPIPYLGLERIW